MLPATADCVIVGGGVVGCSLAYRLGLHGVKTVVVEAAQIGSGSTAKCAGGVRQQFSTEINVRVGMLSRRLLERFGEEMGSSAGLRQIGYLFLASSEDELARFRAQVEMQHGAGLDDVRVVTVEEISDLVPELNVADLHGGTYCPSDGLAGPSDVTLAYVKAARRAGVEFVEECAVLELGHAGGRIDTVRTAQGTVSTPMVVDCAGPHAAEVAALAGLEIPIKPYRRHIFTTEQFAMQKSIPMTVDFRTSFYFHPEGDGLLLGMSDPDEPSSFNTNVDWKFLEHLVEHAAFRLPALEAAEIKAGWAGLYEVSPDHQAIVGETHLPGFWICGGFSGHGFMQAPAIGMLLADQMVGKRPEIDIGAFSPQRFARPQRLVAEAAVI